MTGFASTGTFEAALGSGTIRCTVNRADIPPNELFGFALRNNPNRAVLVVSKVAGRHIPVRPSRAREAYKMLASKVDLTALPGPVVVIALAESAIGLGHGVCEELQQRLGENLLFIHSTRHKFNVPVAVAFHEEHSHATEEFIYFPRDRCLRELFRSCRTAVIVDDEVTTGKTILNLTNCLQRVMPHLKRVVLPLLTDWRSDTQKVNLSEQMPVEVDVVSLFEGSLEFTPGLSDRVESMPSLKGRGLCKDGFLSKHHGRCGLYLPANTLPGLDQISNLPKGNYLVLATEEFAHPPFLLAESLELAGHDVVFQSTTRTPVRVHSNSAIKSRLVFPDESGDGIENFLYNVRPGQYDHVIICHEAPASATYQTLRDQLTGGISCP